MKGRKEKGEKDRVVGGGEEEQGVVTYVSPVKGPATKIKMDQGIKLTSEL